MPPVQFPGDEPFWEATKAGKLLLKHCNSCGETHYYPRPHCPYCGSKDTRWIESSGQGQVYANTVQLRSPRPTAPAIIQLKEGPRITSVVMDADVHALRIGDSVVLKCLPTEGGPPVPAFTTPEAETARAQAEASIDATRSAIDPAQQARVATMKSAAVVGAGAMGVGITMCLLRANFTVTLVDQTEEALTRARQTLHNLIYEGVERGRWSDEDAAAQIARMRTSTAIADIAFADLVIEAVWEQLALKQEVFANIDKHARADALLGTNTSALDIDQIAGATSRPERVIGLHFFSPAHVMRLLEIVKGRQTGQDSIHAARALALRLSKVGVVVGSCEGFVGNRLMIARERQAHRLILEGALPAQIDTVLTTFGLPMGTFQLQDMAGGIELSYRRRQSTGQPNWLNDQMYAQGRLGRKTGKGYYRYKPDKREPLEDPEVTALIEEASRQAGITRRSIDDQELTDRLILPMINEGAKIIEEGIVERASDIDAVWLTGFGWPTWKGGPMHWADTVGARTLLERLQALEKDHGADFKPAALLQQLACEGGTFIQQNN